jgi:transposase
LVDALGNPARRTLIAGQTHDVTQAEPLRDGVRAERVVADKDYDSRTPIDAVHARHSEAVIPPRSNSRYPRKFDPHVDKARNRVERFFNHIKHVRRVATGYDKLDGGHHAFVAAVSILIRLA